MARTLLGSIYNGAELRTIANEHSTALDALEVVRVIAKVGATGHTAAIQSAVNAAAARNPGTFTYGTGGTVNRPRAVVDVPGGVYDVTSLTIPEGVVIDWNNSIVTGTSAATMFDFVGGSTSGVYAGIFAGMRNVLIDGDNIATKGIRLLKTNFGKFENVSVQGCVRAGWDLQEVQYSSFHACHAFRNGVGFLLTSRSDAMSLTTIDNIFMGCGASQNRYGVWLQNASKNAFYKLDASRNTVVDVLFGAELQGYLSAYQVTSGGSGYPVSSYQPVTITGGGGSGAQAYAQVNASGVVTGVYGLDCGAGYTSAPTISVGGGGTGATVTATISTDAGLSDWNGAAPVVRDGNTFYDIKCEHNRDDIPCSGYAIWQRTGRNNTFFEPSIHRQASGTARPNSYYKFARADDFGLVLYGFAEIFDGTLTRPGSATDVSVFRSTVSQGVHLVALDYSLADFGAKLAVDAADALVTDGKFLFLGHDGQGRVQGKFASVSTSALSFDKARVQGDADDRFRQYVTGELRWGDGTATPDVVLKRAAANVLALGSGDGLGVGNSVSNANTPTGATSRALPIYSEAGALLGYIPIYAAQW